MCVDPGTFHQLAKLATRQTSPTIPSTLKLRRANMSYLLSDMYELIVESVMSFEGPDDLTGHLDGQQCLARMMRISKVRSSCGRCCEADDSCSVPYARGIYTTIV